MTIDKAVVAALGECPGTDGTVNGMAAELVEPTPRLGSATTAPHPGGVKALVAEGMTRIAGGTFRMGDDRFYPEEAPVRAVEVDDFWIDEHAVTAA